MKAGIFNPYLDTLGGGERYTMAVAETLLKAGYSVFLESKDKSIMKKLGDRFGRDFSKIEAINSIKRGDGYDVCFWLSDGSIPRLLARKNILHFQRPFYGVDGKSLISRTKFFRINQIVVNSKFTKRWIDKEYPKKSLVIYPPVDTKSFKIKKKENLIFSLGRFSQLEQSKRQDILLKVFQKLHDKHNLLDWKLVMAGGSEVGRTSFVDKLKENAKGYPVEIVESPSFKTVKDYFSKAKIYWTASGFGVDETKQPEKVEHFGIALVEAMTSGGVPLALSAGGHKEIVKEAENGFLWATTSSLLNRTKKLTEDSKLLKKLSLKAREDSEKYSYERFEREFTNLL